MNSKKINLSIIQYGGYTYRTMINLACNLNKDKFNVSFFWCHPGQDLLSKFKHPLPSKEEVISNNNKLRSSGVFSYEFKVKKRFVPDPNLPWIETNFFQIYNEIKTDIVFSWRAGRVEFPFCHIEEPVIEWNVFGQYDPSENIIKSLAISPWVKEEYIKNGGLKDKCEVVYLPLSKKIVNDDFRKELGIDSDTIVLGMHQRKEDTIFSKVSLDAINYVANNTNKKIFTLFLGGSDLYKQYAQKLGIQSHFLDSSYDYSVVSKFLNTLDIYTHARKDGETLGAAIQEAMFHGLPIISHESQWNAHIDTIGPGGIVCKNQKQYNEVLIDWVNKHEKVKKIGLKAKNFAIENYSYNPIIEKIENIFIQHSEFRLLNWSPLQLEIYKKRKIRMLIRYFLIQSITFFIVNVFGQKATRIISWVKHILIKIKK